MVFGTASRFVADVKSLRTHLPSIPAYRDSLSHHPRPARQ